MVSLSVQFRISTAPSPYSLESDSVIDVPLLAKVHPITLFKA